MDKFKRMVCKKKKTFFNHNDQSGTNYQLATFVSLPIVKKIKLITGNMPWLQIYPSAGGYNSKK